MTFIKYHVLLFKRLSATGCIQLARGGCAVHLPHESIGSGLQILQAVDTKNLDPMGQNLYQNKKFRFLNTNEKAHNHIVP